MMTLFPMNNWVKTTLFQANGVKNGSHIVVNGYRCYTYNYNKLTLQSSFIILQN